MALTAEQLGPFGVRLREALAVWMTDSLERACAAIAEMGFNDLLELIEEEGTQGQVGWVPPWGKLLSPSLCPAAQLPFLGQWVGVEVPKGTPEGEARALVKAESGLARGTQASVEAAIIRAIAPPWTANTAYTKGQLLSHQPVGEEVAYYEVTANFMSGSSFSTEHLTKLNIATQYELLSREKANGETNAYYFTILCHPQQLRPSGNLGQMESLVNAAKFAGLIPEYVLTEEPLQTDPYIDEGTLLIENVAEAVQIETATLSDIT